MLAGLTYDVTGEWLMGPGLLGRQGQCLCQPLLQLFLLLGGQFRRRMEEQVIGRRHPVFPDIFCNLIARIEPPVSVTW